MQKMERWSTYVTALPHGFLGLVFGFALPTVLDMDLGCLAREVAINPPVEIDQGVVVFHVALHEVFSLFSRGESNEAKLARSA